jgi:YidC/Oxa1 family membrane protein insertase
MNPIDFLVDKMMLPILEKAFTVTGSYGWAIVFLTLIIRMVLLPLTMQSYYSMKSMQKIQPKLKKIQERYKNKPEELNKRMIALYRENKVNPLGGCLPLLVQMPFLFALYAALIGEKFKAMLAAPEVSKSFFFMPDLARVGIYSSDTGLYLDNLFLLAAFTLSTIVQQKTMTPAPSPDADPRQVAIQKQMAVMMPIMITVMFLIIPVPTGIYLYLVVSNLIGIGQYVFLNHHSARREALAAANNPSTHAADDLLEDDDDEAEAVSVTASSNGTPADDASADQKYRVKKSGKKKKKRK